MLASLVMQSNLMQNVAIHTQNRRIFSPKQERNGAHYIALQVTAHHLNPEIEDIIDGIF